MCRLFGFSFTETTNEEDKIKTINAFRQLAVSGAVPKTIPSGHNDGWGFVVYESDIPRVYKSTASAAEDNVFKVENYIKPNTVQSGLAHLRKKTVGETNIVNTHPFTQDRFSFIHNGTVAKGDEPYANLTKECKGDTDSERLFLHFLKVREAGMTTQEAYRSMLTETKMKYPTFSALNTMLHDGECIYISRIINTAYPGYEELQLGSYYTLYVGKDNAGNIYISSEKIPYKSMEYSLLPNMSVSVINLKTGDLTTEEII